VKELDSLKIVVDQSMAYFKTIDSSACAAAYAKQYTYSSFINVHLKDTITKMEADDLQLFCALGKNMGNYLAMRSTWLSEAQTAINQLSNLSRDLKSGSIKGDEAIDFINEEKKIAEKTIDELKKNTEVMREQLDLFAKTLPVAETIITRINKGMLPKTLSPEIKHY